MLSAVQPSKSLTLGNYLGAIKNWVQLQHDFDCLFFAVDLHTITVRQEDPAALRDRTYRAIATYLAAGIDPKEATLFVQSHVPEHAELAWLLTCYTYMGELSRMTQFKDKSAKAQTQGDAENSLRVAEGQHVGAGLFIYPTLMAADILLYGTHLVPVGEDQKQHIELARDLAVRMRKLYGEDTFTIPEVYISKVGARVMSLQDPTQKMSKSDPDLNATVFLDDTDDQIRKKLKRAVTDSGSEIQFDIAQKPGVSNLLSIQSAITGKTIETLVGEYAGKQYGHLKVDTAEIVAQKVGPLRQEVEKLMADRTYLDSILKSGAERARQRAQLTLQRIYDRVGFLPGRY